MNKTTITILIIILLALGMWAALGNTDTDMPGTGSEKPEDVITGTDEPTETIDTSDWVTYRNEEMGFEVKHPEGWGIRVHDQKNISIGPYIDEQVYSLWSVRKEIDTNVKEVVKNETTLLEMLNETTKLTHDFKTEKTTYKSKDAILLTSLNSAPDAPDHEIGVIFIEDSNDVYSFPVSGFYGDAEHEQISFYQGLIDTFKLLNSSE